MDPVIFQNSKKPALTLFERLNMRADIVDTKWKELNNKIRKWLDNRRAAPSISMNSKSEQFVEILQKRYGYTKEKATSELKKHYSKIIIV